MAKVIVKQIGGTPQEKEAGTVGELKKSLGLTNHTATVNGEPADEDQELADYQVVHFAQAVKGGREQFTQAFADMMTVIVAETARGA